MNSWSLLLLVCLAVFQPITAKRYLVDGQDQSCDPHGYRLACGHPKTEDRRLSRDYRDQSNEVRRSLLSRPLIDERIGVSIRTPVFSESQVSGFRRKTDIRREADIRQDRRSKGKQNNNNNARETQDREYIQEYYTRNSARKNANENLIRTKRTIQANRDRPDAQQRSARSYEIRQYDQGFEQNKFDRTYERHERRNSMDAYRAATGRRDVEELGQVQKTRQIRSIFQRERQDVAQGSVTNQIRGRNSRAFEIRHSSIEQREYRESMQRRSFDQARNIKHEVRRRRSFDSLRVARHESQSPVKNDRKVTYLSRSRSVTDRNRDARDETRRYVGQVRNVDVANSRQDVEQFRDTRESRRFSEQIYNVRNIALSRSAFHNVRFARDETRSSMDRTRNSREIQNARYEFQQSPEQFRNVRETVHLRSASDLDGRVSSRRSQEQVRNLRHTVHSRSAADRDGRVHSRRSHKQDRNVRNTVHSKSPTDRVAIDNSRRSHDQVRNPRDTAHSRSATDRGARDNSRRSHGQVRNLRDTIHSRLATDRDGRVYSRISREQSHNVRDKFHTRPATDRVRDVSEYEKVRIVRDAVLTRKAVDRVNTRNVRSVKASEVRYESRRLMVRTRDNVRDTLQVLTNRDGQDRVRDTMMIRKSYFKGLARESQRVRNAHADTGARETQGHVQQKSEIWNGEPVMGRPDNSPKERQHLDVTREMKTSPIRADYRIVNNLERSLVPRFTVNTQASDIRKGFVSLIQEPQHKLDTMSWHYILYALQGIYLCGMITQLLCFESEKNKSRSLWWIPRSYKLLKVD